MPNNQPLTTPPVPDMNPQSVAAPTNVQPSEPTPMQASAPASGSSSSLLLVVGVLIVVAALAAGAYYFLMPMMQVATAPVPTPEVLSASPEAVAAQQQTDQVAAELEAFSTAELDAELNQIETELAQ